MRQAKYDMNKVMMLINVIDKARQYPDLAPIAEEANLQLKEMIREQNDQPGPRIVTPPGGPANSARLHPDGTMERLEQPQQLNATLGKRDEVTGQPIPPGAQPDPTQGSKLEDPSHPAGPRADLTDEENRRRQEQMQQKLDRAQEDQQEREPQRTSTSPADEAARRDR
jgi:hypothetical protein